LSLTGFVVGGRGVEEIVIYCLYACHRHRLLILLYVTMSCYCSVILWKCTYMYLFNIKSYRKYTLKMN